MRGKAGWSKKINDPAICAKYVAEAESQGAEANAAWQALSELRELVDKIVEEEHIQYDDHVIPADVRDVMKQRLDQLANQPNKDWHPGSEQRVLDIIHPSLFCYVEGVSPINPTSPWINEAKRKMLLKQQVDQAQSYRRKFESSNGGYQWLPSLYAVSKDGEVTVDSYINNLERKAANVPLYDALAKGFEASLPLLERVMGKSPNGNTLQVITKACNYIIPPGASYQGNWHVEGMPTEHIVASIIYYYENSGFLEDDGLAFRRERDKQFDSPGWEFTHENPPSGGERDMQMNIELGAVPTTESRVLCFRNDFQHCVTLLHNPSKTETAYRKIVCWFVINPDVPIISTADVPPQQWEIRMVRQGVALILASRKLLPGRSLPRDCVIEILKKAHIGMTLAEAHKHREALMKERKVHVNAKNEEMEREYSLCEH